MGVVEIEKTLNFKKKKRKKQKTKLKVEYGYCSLLWF